jgi:hypothetical protein
MAEQQSTKTLILVNDTSRIRQYPMPRKVADGMIEHDTLRIMPGANRIDSQIYAEHKATLESEPNLYLLEKPFNSLSERDATAIVTGTIDLVLLEAFKSQEKRKPILAKIDAQIEECSKKAKAS